MARFIIDAHKFVRKHGGTFVEVRFMEGTNSHEKYGSTVGGIVTQKMIHDVLDIVTIKGLNMVTNTNAGSSVDPTHHLVSLAVNAGGKYKYNLDDTKVVKLKNEGFSVFDIEPNGTIVLPQE